MEINVEFAKKMTRPAKGTPGITLRSMAGDPVSCLMIVMADSYAEIRDSVRNYRMMTARSLTAVSRGKSLEIKAEAAPGESPDAIAVLFDFIRTMKFNTEDALDVVEFCNAVFGAGAEFGLRPLSIDLTPDALSFRAAADAADDDAAELLIRNLSEFCTKYQVGIIR